MMAFKILAAHCFNGYPFVTIDKVIIFQIDSYAAPFFELGHNSRRELALESFLA